MPKTLINGELEIAQDLERQHKVWRYQAWTRPLLALIVIGALLGLFGSAGPLNQNELRTEDARVTVEYERFANLLSPTVVKLSIDSTLAPGGKAIVWLSPEFADRLSIKRITPRPERERSSAEGIEYTFELGNALAPSAIHFDLEPGKAGRSELSVQVAGAPKLAFSQWVYP